MNLKEKICSIVLLSMAVLLFSKCHQGEMVPEGYNTKSLNIPMPYKEQVRESIKIAGDMAGNLIQAFEEADDAEKEAVAFLIANMPERDLKSLSPEYILGFLLV